MKITFITILLAGISFLANGQDSIRAVSLPIPPADPSAKLKTISQPYALQKELVGKGPAYADDIQMEYLDRGFVAIAREDGGVSLSWRMLKGDTDKTAFNLYRREILRKGRPAGENATVSANPSPKILKSALKLNAEPLVQSTYFIDDSLILNEGTSLAGKGYVYYLEEIASLQNPFSKPGENLSDFSKWSSTRLRSSQPYIRIPLPQIAGDSLWRYRPNDASIGDLDGDGSYEIVLKRTVGNYACTQTGISGGTNHLEAYTMDGRQLWSVDIGINVREGAQYFHFMVYDFDGDGKSEIICKTAEGTVFADGKTIGDANNDGITDYVIRDKNRPRVYGKVDECPEFLSVIEGATGKELARGEYIYRGCSEDWGDDIWNRSDRQLTAVAYLDGKHPSFLVGRGYNGRSVVEAWDFLEGKFTKRWRFDTHNGQTAASFKTNPLPAEQLPYLCFANQGNHNLRIGDVDADGKDEIIYGSCVIDDDGSGLYSTGWGHGDAIHMTDIDIDRPGLEIWQCHECAPTPYGSTLRDAATGECLLHYPSNGDVGRAMCADIDPRYRGCEVWSLNTGGVRSAKGELISSHLPSVNMAVWWDGDLSRELLDKIYVDKWTGDGTKRLFDGSGKGITWNNGTKSNPCLQADIFGDWREEIIWPSEDGREVRIYMTEYPTEHRFVSFMQDPIYRISVAVESVGYNQPTAPGFYFGTDKK